MQNYLLQRSPFTRELPELNSGLKKSIINVVPEILVAIIREAVLAFDVLILIQASLTKNVKWIRTSCASLFTRDPPEVNSGLKKSIINVVPEVLVAIIREAMLGFDVLILIQASLIKMVKGFALRALTLLPEVQINHERFAYFYLFDLFSIKRAWLNSQ